MVHEGAPSLINSKYRPKTTCMLVDSMGGIMAHFHRDLEWNGRQGENMVICFTQPIRNGRDCLYSSVTAYNHRLPFRNVGHPSPWDSTWGRITFGTDVGLDPPRRFGPSSEGTMNSCYQQRQISWTPCTDSTAWGMALSALGKQ